MILVFLYGGPPHLDMYDLKAGAPSEFRGVFHPISTIVAGIEICEFFSATRQVILISSIFPRNYPRISDFISRLKPAIALPVPTPKSIISCMRAIPDHINTVAA